MRFGVEAGNARWPDNVICARSFGSCGLWSKSWETRKWDNLCGHIYVIQPHWHLHIKAWVSFLGWQYSVIVRHPWWQCEAIYSTWYDNSWKLHNWNVPELGEVSPLANLNLYPLMEWIISLSVIAFIQFCELLYQISENQDGLWKYLIPELVSEERGVLWSGTPFLPTSNKRQFLIQHFTPLLLHIVPILIFLTFWDIWPLLQGKFFSQHDSSSPLFWYMITVMPCRSDVVYWHLR
jgi:hypothetical protein